MTRVLISADMEGATGTVLPADVEAGTPRYERFRRLLTQDVNAAVAGFADAGADEVVVNDAHCGMDNILIEELDPRAVLIVGRHKPLGMMQGLETGVDAVAFVGYHTGAGEEGVLAHTYLSHSILGVRVDGEPVGEGEFNALVSAESGSPVVLVTGDDVTCRDAARYAPGCRTVTVKTAISRHAAICRTPAATTADIRGEAAAALSAAPPRPTARPTPHVVEVDVDSRHLVQRACALTGVEQAGPRTVRMETPDAREALRRFRALTWVIGGGREGDWT
ncbi:MULTISPECIES: M55 family metallopeptidase [unclassified Streptomyces]|uniref:M55 family metallopeptidase n=1 Tax=unclassified Streptomyces TaxID=2593676 RepID=UPI002E2B8C19|nr:M55 family metallopeptidase [Streptomyces sp. NBC_00334]